MGHNLPFGQSIRYTSIPYYYFGITEIVHQQDDFTYLQMRTLESWLLTTSCQITNKIFKDIAISIPGLLFKNIYAITYFLVFFRDIFSFRICLEFGKNLLELQIWIVNSPQSLCSRGFPGCWIHTYNKNIFSTIKNHNLTKICLAIFKSKTPKHIIVPQS